MEEGEFKNWIEKMQARLMSSSVDTPQQLQSVFESLIAKKQSLCEVLQAWNNRYALQSGVSVMFLQNLLCHDVFNLNAFINYDFTFNSQVVEVFIFLSPPPLHHLKHIC